MASAGTTSTCVAVDVCGADAPTRMGVQPRLGCRHAEP